MPSLSAPFLSMSCHVVPIVVENKVISSNGAHFQRARFYCTITTKWRIVSLQFSKSKKEWDISSFLGSRLNLALYQVDKNNVMYWKKKLVKSRGQEVSNPKCLWGQEFNGWGAQNVIFMLFYLKGKLALKQRHLLEFFRTRKKMNIWTLIPNNKWGYKSNSDHERIFLS